MPSAHGIFIEIIGDATSIVKSAERSVKALLSVDVAAKKASQGTIAANEKTAASNTLLTRNFKANADAQIAARVKAQTALEANIAGFAAKSRSFAKGSQEQKAAVALQAEEQAKLNRLLGVSAASTARFGNNAKTAERDLNKMVRGVVAGSGALSGLGRSLAFSSTGFIAASLAAAGVVTAVRDAEDLARAQESLDVAIKHTGGNLRQLQPRYEAVAKSAAQFGISEIEASTGLARATVLTGNAAAAQRAYQEALVISKATGKDFNVVLTATSKGQEGITTSLRRYGILVDSTSTGQEQFNLVMKRFGGQATANTTAMDKLHAAFANALTTIGVALLPTFEKLANSLAKWLTKMNESGRLEKDVAAGMGLIHDVASPLIGVITDLASAFRGLNSAWQDFNNIGDKLGVGGFPKASEFIKGGIQNLTPLHQVTGFIDSFRSHAPPPAPLIQPSRFFPVDAQFGRAPPTSFNVGRPMKQFFQKFELNFREQMAQLQAGLTRSSKDDVAAAREVVARIKRKVDEGVLHGQALRDALSLEAQALSTIWAAEDAAAQKRAQRAQAAKERIQKQIEDAIDPVRLEIGLARAELSGSTPRVIRALKALRAAAQKMLDSGKLSADQQLQALQQIISLNQQIKDAATQQTAQFQVPAKLAFRLARDQALGRDTTKDLLSIRKAILHFIATHKKNFAALTDAYQQLADINQQLGSSAQSALGSFKQQSTRALLAGINLTQRERELLRARLSQRGPGGTVPGEGVGAGGFIIGPNGRPIRVRGRGATISARDSQTVSPARFNRLIRVLEQVAQRPVRVVVDLDGRIIADNTTRHQQRRRDRNSAQRRGPTAGIAGG